MRLTIPSLAQVDTSVSVDLGDDPIEELYRLSQRPNFFFIAVPEGATFTERQAAAIITDLHKAGHFSSYAPLERHNAHDASIGLFIDLLNAGAIGTNSRDWRYCYADRESNGWHSWLEYKGVAIDFSNGTNLVLRTRMYYRSKNFKTVTRLTPDRFTAYLDLDLFPFTETGDSAL